MYSTILANIDEQFKKALKSGKRMIMLKTIIMHISINKK